MPIKPNCIITGCDLYFPDTNQRAHGDLFELGDCFIFNAVLKGGETMLLDANGLANRFIEIDLASAVYFERRGVFIVAKQEVVVSEAVQRTILTWSRP